MRVTVTGGAGFIGAHLVRRLEAANWDVMVLDDLSNASADSLAGCAAKLIVADVNDVEALESTCEGSDAIVHLAALSSVVESERNPLDCHDRNTTSTLRVLETARVAGQHVVIASSAAVYGNADAVPIVETAPVRPLGPYGASKAAAELYAGAYSAAFSLRTLVLRFFNVFGPGQDPARSGSVISNFTRSAMDGVPLRVHGDGRQTRDFISVSHVCNVIEDALRRSVAYPSPVNIGSGTAVSIAELAAAIEGLLGVRLPLAYAGDRPGDAQFSCADNRLQNRLFPGLSTPDFAGGLAETVGWMSKQSSIKGAVTQCA